MGVNSSVADRVMVAENNFIAMGTAIRKNTKQNSMYVGSLAENKGIDTLEFFKVKD
jgi:bifunctional N-acetylglucosamine-1-phosphate-uridyltransferase/glucosamine-1-phosphate-acetyltransferase GlmU-like protein